MNRPRFSSGFCRKYLSSLLSVAEVNYVFLLWSNMAEPERLTVSDEIPEGSIPKSLEDCFVSAGEFEGWKIWHTKKSIMVNPGFNMIVLRRP